MAPFDSAKPYTVKVDDTCFEDYRSLIEGMRNSWPMADTHYHSNRLEAERNEVCYYAADEVTDKARANFSVFGRFTPPDGIEAAIRLNHLRLIGIHHAGQEVRFERKGVLEYSARIREVEPFSRPREWLEKGEARHGFILHLQDGRKC